ncbi:MAG TPA: DUF4340 domain-containing protein [Pirellulales bacterium]|jgi:hypothetical protein
MSETNKTLSFVGAAAVLLLTAFMLRPSTGTSERQGDIGQEFFPEFKDPLTATSMEVVEYDEPTGGLRPFKVAQINGVWSIPSHEGYPADAKNQLEQAAVSVIGLKKLSMVSEAPGDQSTYGVVDPDAAKLQPGDSGVGKRVTLEDKGGNKLAQIIIGKKDPDQPDLHYVRVPGQDRIYRAKVKTDKLSTKFQNWIEEDLLKLNAFDVKQVVMDDHSVDELNREQPLVQRGLTIVDFDNKDSKWTLEKMEGMDPASGKWEEFTLKDDEELDAQKLNELKTALDDLKIVDVRHKPAGLSKDLKVGEELVADRATRQALQQRGFYLAPVQGGFALFSNEGEVRCGLNDGVEYILRFGEIAGQGSEDEDEADKPAEKKEGEADAEKEGDKPKDEKEKEKGVDRYIMVTAQFRPDLIPKPELQPLPEGAEDEPAAEKPAAEKPADSAAEAKPTEGTEAKPADEQPKAETPAAEPAKEAPAEAPKNESSRFAPGDENLLALADDAALTQLAQVTEEPPKQDEPANANAAPAEQPAEADAAEKKPAAPVDPDAAAEAEEKAQAAKRAEIKRIKEDNKRKEDEYNKKIADGEKRVKELNERFADWYYVISDGTYKKIHISREQLVKKKTDPAKPAGEGNNPIDFDALKGLQGLPK